MARTGSIRSSAIDAGFAVAERLDRIGLGPLTHRVRRLIARSGGGRHTVEFRGLEIGGPLAEYGTYLRSLTTFGAHPFQVDLLADAIEPGSVVLDCGAHIGLHTLIAARATGPDGTVVAVEASPPTAQALRENVIANGFDDRVEIVEAAAVEEAGTVEMGLDPWPDRSGLRSSAEEAIPFVEVPGVNLDEVMAGRPFAAAKIDIEGGEAGALAGLDQTLARSRGAMLFVECHPDRMAGLGVEPEAWSSGLCELGPVELIDDAWRRLDALDRAGIAQLVRERPAGFNLRIGLR